MDTKETPEQLRIRRLLYSFPYGGCLNLVLNTPLDYTAIADILEKLSHRISMASAESDQTSLAYNKLRTQVLAMRELLGLR